MVDGARREVREECGIEIEIGALVATYEPIEWDAEGRVEYHYVVIDFWAQHRQGEVNAQDDAAEAVWMDVASLTKLSLTPETREVIQTAYTAWRQHTAKSS